MLKFHFICFIFLSMNKPVLSTFIVFYSVGCVVADAVEQLQEVTMSFDFNVCNLNLIYNSDFEYSLPQRMLGSFLSGKAFDNKENYTEEESENLIKDINELYQQIISAKPVKDNIAIITAGAPGVGKTVKARQELEANALQGKHYAYICPDDVCLPKQTRTYKADLEKSDNSPEERLNIYNKWRPASNAATHLILGNLIREKYAFYFGSTSSSPNTGIFFEFLKTQGYRIKLIHVSSPDHVRWASIQERDKTFVQTTEHDVREKGKLLPQRINDTFLKYADEIEFHYRDEVTQDAKLAAKWLRNEISQECLGVLQIIDQESYEKIKTIHNEAAKALSRPDLYWEHTVENASQIL